MRSVALSVLALAALALVWAPPVDAKPHQGACVPGDPQSPRCFVWSGRVTFVDDGDTIEVDIDGDGTRRSRRIRVTGINATELSRYSSRPERRRGECHGVEATALFERLIVRSRRRVRLVAQRPSSRSGVRLRRSVRVRVGGRWRDAGPFLLRAGLAVWLPNGVERAWNLGYSRLAQQAAARGAGLFDASSCGAGPEPQARLRMRIRWDADGNDHQNVNGEWFEVENLDADRPVHVGGWWLRDSDLRRFVLPARTTIPAGGRIRLHMGRGRHTGTDFFWGFRHPILDTAGDGAYLFDPDGDVRAWMVYPCRWRCGDALAGALELAAQPAGRRERVTVRNASGAPADLDGYALALPYQTYDFRRGSTLAPGETMVVDVQGQPADSNRLHRYLGLGEHRLADGGQRVVIRSHRDVAVACAAWGGFRC